MNYFVREIFLCSTGCQIPYCTLFVCGNYYIFRRSIYAKYIIQASGGHPIRRDHNTPTGFFPPTDRNPARLRQSRQHPPGQPLPSGSIYSTTAPSAFLNSRISIWPTNVGLISESPATEISTRRTTVFCGIGTQFPGNPALRQPAKSCADPAQSAPRQPLCTAMSPHTSAPRRCHDPAQSAPTVEQSPATPAH